MKSPQQRAWIRSSKISGQQVRGPPEILRRQGPDHRIVLKKAVERILLDDAAYDMRLLADYDLVPVKKSAEQDKCK
jgi:hypothetical protein